MESTSTTSDTITRTVIEPFLSLPLGSVVYISGPITGVKNENREAFETAKQILETQGFVAVNPLDLNDALEQKLGRKPTYSEAIREDFRVISTDCVALYMLHGAHRSPGAQRELEMALAMRMPIYFEAGG